MSLCSSSSTTKAVPLRPLGPREIGVYDDLWGMGTQEKADKVMRFNKRDYITTDEFIR